MCSLIMLLSFEVWRLIGLTDPQPPRNSSIPSPKYGTPPWNHGEKEQGGCVDIWDHQQMQVFQMDRGWDS